MYKSNAGPQPRQLNIVPSFQGQRKWRPGRDVPREVRLNLSPM